MEEEEIRSESRVSRCKLNDCDYDDDDNNVVRYIRSIVYEFHSIVVLDKQEVIVSEKYFQFPFHMALTGERDFFVCFPVGSILHDVYICV